MYRHNEQSKPDASLNIDKDEATLDLPNQALRKLAQASYEEVSEHILRVTGTDKETDETVTFDILTEGDTEQTVINVIVDGKVIYKPTLH